MNRKNSYLLDELIDYTNNNARQEIYGEKWYTAKPIGFGHGLKKFKAAFNVLIGKSIAVHFKEDEK